MHRIVFLTLYLGLVAGPLPIEVTTDGDVKMVRMTVDGTPVAALTQPPWRATIDLGATILPREIVAAGFDEKGVEIARASQVINLPRPRATVDILLDNDQATLTGLHVSYEKPRSASLKLDGAPLPLDDRYRTSVAGVDRKHPHVLDAEMRFADGTVARNEVVFGGEFGELVPSQLTPVAVTRTAADTPQRDDCFIANGAALRVHAIEKPDSLVIVVRDPDVQPARKALMPPVAAHGGIDGEMLRRIGALDKETTIRILWPVAERVVEQSQPTAILFAKGQTLDASKAGLFWLLTSVSPNVLPSRKTRWADAVAVAGVNALEGGRRRAVILVLGGTPDMSLYSPRAARNYLAAISVPLFVWSVTGPRPDWAESWGDVVDVSSPEKLNSAAEEVRRKLDAQRIAWIDAEPLTALRAEVQERCGYAALR